MADGVSKTGNCLEESLEKYMREGNINWLVSFIE